MHNEIGATERCTSYQTCNLSNIGARRAVCTSGFKPGASYSGTALPFFLLLYTNYVSFYYYILTMFLPARIL